MSLFLHLMALFKFRKTPAEALAGSQPPPTVEQLRLRAKYRLVGASILVLVGVLVFPLMFDKQPRPLPSDTPMVLLDPVKPGAPAQAVAAPAKPVLAPKPSIVGGLDKGESIVVEKTSPETVPAGKSSVVKAVTSPELPKAESKSVARLDPKPETKPDAKPEPKPEYKPEQKAAGASPAQSAEAQRVLALLDGKTASAAQPAPVDSVRFVVQVGAFAELERAQEVRLKIERAGLKTYTQVAQTREGQRIRVRVGPFEQKADAEKASEQVRKLDLPAVILSL